jgi:hypothetical protein
MNDFADILTLQIKHEIANRYFGFRNDIEQQSLQYLQSLALLETQKPHPFQEVLLRLEACRQLYVNEPLFARFFSLTGLPQQLADRMSSNTPVAFKNLAKIHCPPPLLILCTPFYRVRYRKFNYRSYQELSISVADYCRLQDQLELNYNNICADIETFRRNNDLGAILDFIRRLESSSDLKDSSLGAYCKLPRHSNLHQELLPEPPPPVDSVLPRLTVLPDFKDIQASLAHISDQAHGLLC